MMIKLYKKGIIFIILVLIMASCRPIVPATVPPQLSQASGVFIQIDDERVYAPNFNVAYPQGWRVIKISTANEPVRFVFASPDNTMLITISDVPLGNSATPDPSKVLREDVLEGIYLQGEAPLEQSSALDRAYDGVLASLVHD